MGRKRRSNIKGKTRSVSRRQDRDASTGKTKSRKPVVLGGIALTVLLGTFLLIQSNSPRPDLLDSSRKPFPPPKPPPNLQTIVFEDFVGSEVCSECHAEEYEVWRQSTHGRAGGSPESIDIIGKFNREVIHFKDAKVIPGIDASQNYRFEVEQKGFSKKVFRVTAAIGGGHMYGGGTQTYFAEFPDGTLRFLPFDFIKNENVWFGETKEGKGWVPIENTLSITDLGEWPPNRILGTHSAFENCQQCHGSQISVEYDATKRLYATRYKSLTINCESCHGPGRQHVEIARSGRIEEEIDIGMRALATLDKDESLKVCLSCHALKDALDSGYLSGMNLEAFYSLKFPMFGENPYHPDGRIRAFGYQQNHLYSDCYLNGSMTCVDCHDPHSQDYRDINGQKLDGRFDDRQCTACHASKAVALEEHSNHELDSPGSRCTSCHMPFLQHKSVGDQLKFARSDHTIPIPRPEFDAELGIENACLKCHADKAIYWLQAKTEEWYGEIKPHKAIISNQLNPSEIRTRSQGLRLLAAGDGSHPMAEFSSLSTFIERFLMPDMPTLDPEIVERLQEITNSPDLDLKALALSSLHLAQDNNTAIHNYLADRLSSLQDDEHPIRRRWALALAFLGRTYRDQGDFDNSIHAYNKSLEIIPDDPATLTNLGISYAQKGDLSAAIPYFKRALELNSNEVMAWVSMGIAYQRLGDLSSEKSSYERAIAANPWSPLAHFNLGNFYYKSEQY
ncbi:tetratricopeptide repeat protein, partial [bacterium]|nr:tetratricopeptide repeat protein [bacterium]